MTHDTPSREPATLLADLTVVPMDGPAEAPLGSIREQSIRIVGDRIADLGALAASQDDTVVDCRGLVAVPGFVQGHVHYCQTIARGLADDRPLMDWLRERIWPLEAAHDPASMRASARLSVAELLRGGTTTAQVMESTRHTEATVAVAAESGMTTLLGNCLMDVAAEDSGEGLALTHGESMREVERIHALTKATKRVEYVISPRFVLSCSESLASDAAAYAREHDLRIHTHASEHPQEIELIRELTGRDSILALRDQGLLTHRTSLAHCVHTSPAERAAMHDAKAAVLHCPTANLKLGSGIAPIADYHNRGMTIALGADGAPCNNRLSMLTELRQAALLQALAAGPGVWTAAQALHAATRGGARALGLEEELGSIEIGKRADLVLFDLSQPALACSGDALATIVYAAETESIRHVMAGGTWLVRNGELTTMDRREIAHDATQQRTALLSRARLTR